MSLWTVSALLVCVYLIVGVGRLRRALPGLPRQLLACVNEGYEDWSVSLALLVAFAVIWAASEPRVARRPT